MATADVQSAPGHSFGQKVEINLQNSNKPEKHDVATELYYYKDPGDGSKPRDTYVGQSTESFVPLYDSLLTMM